MQAITFKAAGQSVTIATRGAVETTGAPCVQFALTFGFLTQSTSFSVEQARQLANAIHAAATNAEIEAHSIAIARGL